MYFNIITVFIIFSLENMGDSFVYGFKEELPSPKPPNGADEFYFDFSKFCGNDIKYFIFKHDQDPIGLPKDSKSQKQTSMINKFNHFVGSCYKFICGLDYMKAGNVMARCTKAKKLKPKSRSNQKTQLLNSESNGTEEYMLTLDHEWIKPEKEQWLCRYVHIKNTFYASRTEVIGYFGEQNLVSMYGCKELMDGFTVNEKSYGQAPYSCLDAVNFMLESNTVLPNSGLLLGPKSDYKYIGLCVHHFSISNTSSDSEPRPMAKNSGIKVSGSRVPPEIYLGVLYDSGFYDPETRQRAAFVPQGYKNYILRTSCPIEVSETIHIIAHGAHTHNLGISASLFHWSKLSNETKELNVINVPWKGKMMETDTIFQIPIPVQPGDYLIGTCTLDSSSKLNPTKLGPSEKDEMCGLRIIYTTPSPDKADHFIHCSEDFYGPVEDWIWKNIERQLQNKN